MGNMFGVPRDQLNSLPQAAKRAIPALLAMGYLGKRCLRCRLLIAVGQGH